MVVALGHRAGDDFDLPWLQALVGFVCIFVLGHVSLVCLLLQWDAVIEEMFKSSPRLVLCERSQQRASPLLPLRHPS